MAEGNENTLFRKKTMDRISSPEQLTDYLKVTNPGIWVVLLAIVILLAGMLVWSASGRLETTAPAMVVVQGGKAEIVMTGTGSAEMTEGMTVRAGREEFVIDTIGTDTYGRTMAYAEVSLPDGSYEASVVVESIKPIDFLIRSR